MTRWVVGSIVTQQWWAVSLRSCKREGCEWFQGSMSQRNLFDAAATLLRKIGLVTSWLTS
jgi:hypothetical protein